MIQSKNQPELYICLDQSDWYGWIFKKNEDQQFVSVRKASPFEIEFAEKQAKGGESCL